MPYQNLSMVNYRFIIGYLFLTLLLTHSNVAHGQLSEKQIKYDIARLRDYNQTYEKSVMLKAYEEKLSKIEQLLLNQIYLGKRGPNKDVYREYLERAIGMDSIFYDDELGQRYDYHVLNPIINYRHSQRLTKLEYYKAVYYSFFEKDSDRFIPVYEIPFLKDKYADVIYPIKEEGGNHTWYWLNPDIR
ncbi:hypothetical protein [Sphingobacterium sp. MYb382]|uniref:hypothetical protein n=1 Tax=Sphingobacterium sp. MYb382 TaxID=2745278 RepID=UPI0030AAC0DA